MPKNIMPLERTIRNANKRIVELTYLASKGEVSVNDVLHEYDLTIKHIDEICKNRNRY